MISEVFLRIVERMGREHGVPLPKRLLAIGDANIGWHVVLNPTESQVGDTPAFSATVGWNGWPAGVIVPDGGVLAAGALANERTLLAWLESDQHQGEVRDGR